MLNILMTAVPRVGCCRRFAYPKWAWLSTLLLFCLFFCSLSSCLIPPLMSFSQLSKRNYIARQLKATNTIELMSQLPYAGSFSTETDSRKKKHTLKPEIWTLISTFTSSACHVQVHRLLFFQFPPFCVFFFNPILTSASNLIPKRSTCNWNSITEILLICLWVHFFYFRYNNSM